MKGRLLTFMAGLIVREIAGVWFDYTKGRFHLPTLASVVITVLIGVILAVIFHIAVQVSAAAHNDPDTAFVGWVRFLMWAMLATAAIAMVGWQPYAGAPLLALLIFAGSVAYRAGHLEAAIAELQNRTMPTVPQQHTRVARQRFRVIEDRGAVIRQAGGPRPGLVDAKATKKTDRVLTATGVIDAYRKVTGR